MCELLGSRTAVHRRSISPGTSLGASAPEAIICEHVSYTMTVLAIQPIGPRVYEKTVSLARIMSSTVPSVAGSVQAQPTALMLAFHFHVTRLRADRMAVNDDDGASEGHVTCPRGAAPLPQQRDDCFSDVIGRPAGVAVNMRLGPRTPPPAGGRDPIIVVQSSPMFNATATLSPRARMLLTDQRPDARKVRRDQYHHVRSVIVYRRTYSALIGTCHRNNSILHIRSVFRPRRRHSASGLLLPVEFRCRSVCLSFHRCRP